MNLANKLTLSRIIAVPFVMAALLMDNVTTTLNLHVPQFLIGCKYFALIVFIAATITDLYDGRIARQRKLITPFGSFFDPIADKLLVSAVLICFVEMHLMPAWMVIIIVFREFIITGLRVLAVRKGVDIPAGTLGKHKTVSQMVMIITVLIYIALKSSHGHFFTEIKWGTETLDFWLYTFVYILMLWAVLMTFISGYSYVKDHWDLIIEGAK